MKKIEAIIRPLKLDEVKIALGESGVTGLSVSDVRGIGSSPSLHLPGRPRPSEMMVLTRLEIVARNEDVERIVSIIETYARTGEEGDGKIFVMPMADSIRIRTEERGEQVL